MTKPLLLIVAATMPFTPCIAHAQTYPSRPIRLIMPNAAGSAGDIFSRSVANEVSRQMGQSIVVDNRPGADGIIGYEALARAAPDGYTLGYVAIPFSLIPSTLAKLPFDSARDFQPVIYGASAPGLLAVTKSLPIRSVKELIEYARAKPGALSFGNAGAGGVLHLSMELFKSMTGTNMTPVYYKGSPQAVTEGIGGQIHLVCNALPSMVPHVKAERLRALGVSSLQRAPVLPEVPTIDEAGVPGYEVVTWGGYSLPARTPRAIVLRLNSEINKALASSALSKVLFDQGVTAVGGTPEQFADFVHRETEKWAKVIKAAGIKPQ
jgi:tripartite-type tricarboxylate transporter receptor subunit TctC